MLRGNDRQVDWRVIAVFAVLAALLTLGQHRAGGGAASWPLRVVVAWGRPLQAALTRLAAWPTDLAERASQNASLVEENRELRQQLQEKSAQVTELFQCYLDNKALREQLGLPVVKAPGRVTGRVIDWTTGADQARVTLKLERPGLVDKRDVVTQAAGLVGLVVRVQGDTAEVMLMIDPRAAAGALNLRSRDQGIANPLPGVAPESARLRMEKMQSTADPRVGDLIVTSGLDQVYPPGLSLGTVDKVERDAASAERIEALIRPAVDFSRLEYVWVLQGR